MHYKPLSSLYSSVRHFVEDNDYAVELSLTKLKQQMEESGRVGKVELKQFNQYIHEYGDATFPSTHTLIESIAKNAFKWHRRFSISEIQCYRRCKLQHALKYDERLKPMAQESRYLRVGSWVHSLIEQLYSIGYEASTLDLQILVDGVKQEAYELRSKCETQEEKDQIMVDVAIAEGAINAYYRALFQTEVGQGFSMSKDNVEKAFTVPILSDKSGKLRKSTRYAFRGKIDGLFDGVDGKKYIHEIKTKSGYGDSEREHLKIDDQVTAYVWAMQQLGIDVGGIIYTVIKKPGIVRRKTFEYDVRNNEHRIHEFGFRTKPDYERFIKDQTTKYSEEHYEIRLVEAELKKNNTYTVLEDGEEIATDIRLKSEAQAIVNEKLKPFIEGFLVTSVEGIEDVELYCERIIQDYNERTEFYVFRDIVFRTPEMIKGFSERISAEVKEIAKNNSSTAYPQPAESYLNHCSMCDYRELCLFWYDQNMVNEIRKSKYLTTEQVFEAAEDAVKAEEYSDEIAF
jgi:CRISPR/Cas system-associated exonuclease Cas4 (RecB family)